MKSLIHPALMCPWRLGGLPFAIATALTCHAKLPEPDVIFYGSLNHRGSTLFTPQSDTSHSLLVRLGGVLIAERDLDAGKSAFKLNIPMDDGTGSRLPGTARLGERVRISVRLNSTGTEYEATPPESTGFPLPSGGDLRGFIIPLTLSVTEDISDTAGGLAMFPAWAASFGIDESPNADADGDGMVNVSEYVSGTNPTDAGEVLRISEIRRTESVTALRFGPVRHNRRYRIWCTSGLGVDSWIQIGDLVPEQAAVSQWFDHISVGKSTLFYRITVDFQ
jgi:hypothetical protein